MVSGLWRIVDEADSQPILAAWADSVDLADRSLREAGAWDRKRPRRESWLRTP